MSACCQRPMFANRRLADIVGSMPCLLCLRSRNSCLTAPCLTAASSQGLHPELHPSNFAEDLPKSSYVEEQIFEYPVETSACKAREVYERLVKLDGENPPDLVVAGEFVQAGARGRSAARAERARRGTKREKDAAHRRASAGIAQGARDRASWRLTGILVLSRHSRPQGRCDPGEAKGQGGPTSHAGGSQ